MMDKPVDGCCRGHGIFKNLFPLGEGQIAGDHQTALFIAICQKGKQNLHLFTALLDVPNIIYNGHIKPGEFF